MSLKSLDHGGVFFRRLLSLLLGALTLSAIFTYLIYSFASSFVFTNLKTREYMKRAEFLAEQTASRYLGDLSAAMYNSVMDASPELVDGTVLVYMYKDNNFEVAYTKEDNPLRERELQEAKEYINKYNYQVMNRQLTRFEEKIGADSIRYLFVGYPIVAIDAYSNNESTIGSVYILSSLDEIRQNYTNLNFALILASSVSFLVTLIPLLYFSQKLISPLVETKNVALAMSRGDFSKRANSNSKDEIGDLAKSINNLADDLDRTLRNLMTERNRLQKILNGLSEGILAISSDLKLMHINPALYRLFNIKDKTEKEAFHFVVDTCNLEEVIKEVIEEHSSETLTVHYKNIIIQIQLDVLLDDEKKAYAVVILFRDTTEAEQLEQTRRDYVSNISHELRTPLTAVRALVEPLHDGIVKQESDQKRYYGIILKETLRLSRLIDDMMALSRLQSGNISITKEVIEIEDVLNSILYKYRKPMEEKGITFEIPEENFPIPLLYSNEDRIEQILVILLDNAMKFTKETGKITLFIKKSTRYPDKMEVNVCDTGAGISEEDLDSIFDRFYKADKSRGRTEGTGLGLSIAKELCSKMNEDIWVESNLGKGSTFTFTIQMFIEGVHEDE